MCIKEKLVVDLPVNAVVEGKKYIIVYTKDEASEYMWTDIQEDQWEYPLTDGLRLLDVTKVEFTKELP